MGHLDWQINKSSLECNKYLLEYEISCDVSFKVGEDEEVIKAHKLILSSRSPVFERMFNGSFCESETDPVIPDVGPAAFKTLLRYCYHDSLNIEVDVALTVPYAATKYMLPILETAARKTVIENLDDSKIWEVMKYSTGVHDDKLHAGCMTYLKENLNESNILDVIKYAVTRGDHELHDYCREHFQENLSESNMLDVTKFADSIKDKELHVICTNYLKEHLIASNIWEVYEYVLAEGDTEVHQHCRRYFERDVTMVQEALQSQEFPDTQHGVLLDVLHINDEVDESAGNEHTAGISISEIELFTACNAWAEAKCLRQGLDPTGTNKRTVLGECLALIRFPTMLLKDLVTLVYPTGILTQAGVVNLGRYMYRDPGTECQVDFPARERQFLVKPSGSYISNPSTSTVHIEPEVRVLLSRVWTWWTGAHTVTVRDESFQKSWSAILNAKHENHVSRDYLYIILQYIDIEPPQVLEAGTKYSISAECKGRLNISKKRHVNYIEVPAKLDPYKEVKLKRDPKTINNIYAITLSLI